MTKISLWFHLLKLYIIINMANVRINQNNFDNKINDWKVSDKNRLDTLYFLSDELNEREINLVAWKKGILISISKSDFISKITFIDILI